MIFLILEGKIQRHRDRNFMTHSYIDNLIFSPPKMKLLGWRTEQGSAVVP